MLKGQIPVSDNLYNRVSVKGCYGFIADVKNRNHLLINSHNTPFEISFRQSLSTKYSWQSLLPGTEKGISLKYIDLKNPEYLGNVWALTPFINASVIEKKTWKLSFNASMGIVYASKIYHRTENYRNTIFGSHLNAAIGFGMEYCFYLFDPVMIYTGIDFFHYSNGETTLPNDGMNTGSFFISTGYQFNQRVITVTAENQKFRRRVHMSIIPVIGWKDVSPVKSRKYLNAALSAEYSYTLTRILNIGAGIAFFFDGSMKQLYLNDIEEGEDVDNSYRQVKAGLYILNDINFYPVMIHIETGYYLVEDRIKDRSRVFNRIGLRYFIHDRYFINITHKSHFFFKGDNLEWGVGYIIR